MKRELEYSQVLPENFKEKHLRQIIDIENQTGFMPCSKEQIERAIYNECYNTFACYDNDNIVGYIMVVVNVYDSSSVHIINLAVEENYRRQGIAEDLIWAVWASFFLFYKSITLDVNKENINALNLYKKIGFEPTDIVSSNGDSDIVMKCSMKKMITQKISEEKGSSNKR